MKKLDLKDSKVLQDLQIAPKDLQVFCEYFSIIHHTKGRIRLRASSKLKNYVENSTIDFQSFLDILERTPLISSIKLNALIGSLTICYDSKLLNPKVFEQLIVGENLEEIAETINHHLKELYV